jgi:hypothetical protein
VFKRLSSRSLAICTNYTSHSALAAHFAPRTLLVSSSLSNRPKFLIAPAFGALSRGYAASAFRYAACSACTRAAYNKDRRVSRNVIQI